jgi:hypothetical protein
VIGVEERGSVDRFEKEQGGEAGDEKGIAGGEMGL